MNLLQAVYWFDDALQDAMRAAGYEPLGRSQSLVLVNMAAGEHRAARIAENLGISRQAISQLLSEMASRGLIEFRADPTDRRARVVEFSPGAANVRKAAINALNSFEEELAKRIGTGKVRGLREALAADWGPPPQPPPVRRRQSPTKRGG